MEIDKGCCTWQGREGTEQYRKGQVGLAIFAVLFSLTGICRVNKFFGEILNTYANVVEKTVVCTSSESKTTIRMPPSMEANICQILRCHEFLASLGIPSVRISFFFLLSASQICIIFFRFNRPSLPLSASFQIVQHNSSLSKVFVLQ